ncbi:MAG: FCD domain-containing protein [Nitratireductor sp.]
MATIRDKIYAELISSILGGNMQAGQPFPTEAELCERFQVSRTTVRAALKMLRKANLLDSFQGSGNYVIGLLPGEFGRFSGHFQKGRLQDWFAIRRALEADWAYAAALDRDDSQLKAMRTILSKMEALVPDNPLAIVEYRRLDIDLHTTISAVSGNRLADAMVRLVSPMIMSPLPYEMDLVSVYPGEAEKAMVRHRAIVEAIAERDAGAAHFQMREHVDEVFEVAKSAINASRLKNSGGN